MFGQAHYFTWVTGLGLANRSGRCRETLSPDQSVELSTCPPTVCVEHTPHDRWSGKWHSPAAFTLHLCWRDGQDWVWLKWLKENKGCNTHGLTIFQVSRTTRWYTLQLSLAEGLETFHLHVCKYTGPQDYHWHQTCIDWLVTWIQLLTCRLGPRMTPTHIQQRHTCVCTHSVTDRSHLLWSEVQLCTRQTALLSTVGSERGKLSRLVKIVMLLWIWNIVSWETLMSFSSSHPFHLGPDHHWNFFLFRYFYYHRNASSASDNQNIQDRKRQKPEKVEYCIGNH